MIIIIIIIIMIIIIIISFDLYDIIMSFRVAARIPKFRNGIVNVIQVWSYERWIIFLPT